MNTPTTHAASQYHIYSRCPSINDGDVIRNPRDAVKPDRTMCPECYDHWWKYDTTQPEV